MSLPEGYRPSRTLILRSRGLGDVVLASAAVEALARAFPEVRIDFLAEASAGALLEPDARLERLFLLGGRPGDGRVQGGSMWAAVRWMRQGGVELVVDLFSNPRTALLSALSGAPWRIGLDRRLRRLAYNVRVPRFRGPPEEDHRYALEAQLDFLRAAGIHWPGRARARVFLTEEDRAFAQRTLQRLGYAPRACFGAVLPGGSWAPKRWTVEGFVAVGSALAGRLGARALILWGPHEREDAAAIARELGKRGSLAPPSTLRGMAALLARAAVVVAPDCLGRHLAIVQGVPTVGVFGPTDPLHWTPREGPHRTVRAATEGHARLAELPAEPVIEALEELLEEPVLDAPEGEA